MTEIISDNTHLNFKSKKIIFYEFNNIQIYCFQGKISVISDNLRHEDRLRVLYKYFVSNKKLQVKNFQCQ